MTTISCSGGGIRGGDEGPLKDRRCHFSIGTREETGRITSHTRMPKQHESVVPFTMTDWDRDWPQPNRSEEKYYLNYISTATLLVWLHERAEAG